MGLFRQFFHYATLGIVDSDEQHEERLKRAEEEAKRKATHFDFTNKLQKAKYEEIIFKTAAKFKRISIEEINYQFVTCRVSSSSGASCWYFKIDFNDYGELSGRYWWVYSQNNDATIDKTFADTLSDNIHNFVHNNVNFTGEEETIESRNEPSNITVSKQKVNISFDENGNCVCDYEIITKINNAFLNESLSLLKEVLRERKEIYDSCIEKYNEAAEQNGHMTDIIFEMTKNGSNKCLTFGPYEGFAYEYQPGCTAVVKRDRFDSMTFDEIIDNFTCFYEKGTILNTDDWEF